MRMYIGELSQLKAAAGRIFLCESEYTRKCENATEPVTITNQGLSLTSATWLVEGQAKHPVTVVLP